MSYWISHLMFGDDLLEAKDNEMKCMKCVVDILNKFGAMSGQEVSEEKTCILFSNNVPRSTRVRILQMSM